MVCLALGFGAGYEAGYQYRGIKAQQNIATATDVQVLRHDSPDTFYVRINSATGKPWEGEFKFCDGYVPDWEVSATIKSITYDDQPPCKSIKAQNLGFAMVRNERGQLIKFGE